MAKKRKLDSVSGLEYSGDRESSEQCELLPMDVQRAVLVALAAGMDAKISRDRRGRFYVKAEQLKQVLGP